MLEALNLLTMIASLMDGWTRTVELGRLLKLMEFR